MILSRGSANGVGRLAVERPSGYVVIVLVVVLLLFPDAVGDRREEWKEGMAVPACVPSIKKPTWRCVGTWAVASMGKRDVSRADFGGASLSMAP